MTPLYNIGIRLYSAAIALAATRNDKAKRLRKGQQTTLAKIARDVEEANLRRPGGQWVWFHAASLGEFEQGRPLIERVRSHCPQTKILLTFFSPSGYEIRKDYPGADVVAYLPLDTPANARRLLDTVNPSRVVFIKYEFWGNMLQEVARRKIPAYLVSAIFRPSQIFFRPYGGIFRRILGYFSHIFVQDENSRKLLQTLGVESTVAGDTRFDRVTDIMSQAQAFPSIEQWAKDAENVLVAGSTWPRDEELIFPWLAKNPGVKAIIAPHEFDASRLAQMKAALGDGHTVFLSQVKDSIPEGISYIIVDSIGHLSSLYRYGTFAYVGGGFGEGIHNINEAAVYGIPVVFGPNNGRFKEAADMIAASGAFAIDSEAALTDVLTRLSSDESFRKTSGNAAGQYIARSVGASDRIFPKIFSNNNI